MIQSLNTPSPLVRMLCTTLVFQLVFLPVSHTLAQMTEDSMAPTIVHVPVKTAMKGQTIPITAKVGDDSEVGNVFVHVKKGGIGLDVPIKMAKTGEAGIVKIKVTAEACYVFAGPGMWHDTLATVVENEVFDTYEENEEHGFYRIRLGEGVEGWISFAHSDPVVTGAMYSGAIPSYVTMTDRITYRISAEDIHYNKISTLPYAIHLLEPEKKADEDQEQEEEQDTVEEEQEIAEEEPLEETEVPESEMAVAEEQVVEQAVQARPFYTSPLFVGAVCAGAIGVAVSQLGGSPDEDDEPTTGSINVSGSW